MALRFGFGMLVSAMLLCAGMAQAQAQEADLSVAKAGPDTAAADTDVVYTIEVRNGGPDAATDVTLDDPLPPGMTFVSIAQTGPAFSCSTPAVGDPGTVSCSIATLAPAEIAVFTLVAHIASGTPPGATFTNIASASTSAFDPNSENDSGVASTLVPGTSADLLVSKAGPASIAPDADISYLIELANGGPDAALSLSLDDTLPGTLTFVSLQQLSGPALSCSTPAVGSGGTVNCAAASFASGAAATLELVAHVPAGTASGTTFENSASVSSLTPDPNSKNDVSFTTATVAVADLSITKTAPASADAGTEFTYTLSITNAGPDAASGVQLFDTLPAQTRLVSVQQDTGPAFACGVQDIGPSGSVVCNSTFLAPGASATFSLVVEANDDVPSGTVVVNSASVGSTSSDPDATDNDASATTTFANTADLELAKTGPGTARAGTEAVYSITLENLGADAAVATQLLDALPPQLLFVSLAQSGTPLTCTTPAPGTSGSIDCDSASYPAGAATTLTLTTRVADDAAHGSTITNAASATTTTPESTSANNDASADVLVSSETDLSIDKTAPATAVAGQNLAYQITVANAGPIADDASWTDTLPANTRFVSLVQNGGPAFSCATPAPDATGTVTCTRAAFASGASAAFTLTVMVDAGAANGSSIANSASVDGARVDPVAGNDSDTATATVSNLADVSVTKTGPATATAGANLVYTLTARNDGASPAQNVTLSDVLPASTGFVSLAQTGGPAFACTTPAVGGTGTVDCTLASFASLQVATFTLTVQVLPATAGGTAIANTATIATGSAESDTANNTSTSSANVALPDLALTKTGSASVQQGGLITYTLALSNSGGASAGTIVLTDPLPAGTRFVSLAQTSGPAFACTAPAVGQAGTVSCTIAELAPATSAGFSLVVRALPQAGSPIANTASATSASGESSTANNAGSANTVIVIVDPAAGPILVPASSLSALAWLALMMVLLGGFAYTRRH